MFAPQEFITKSALIVLWNEVLAFNVFLHITRLTNVQAVQTLPLSSAKTFHFRANFRMKI